MIILKLIIILKINNIYSKQLLGICYFIKEISIFISGDIMIILTGGKTGGHIIPLISIAKSINNSYFIGSSNSLEEKLCKEYNINFKGLDLTSNNIFKIIKCLLKLKLNNVDMVISTGGYVSIPVLLYAIIHHIPIYLIEENIIIGTTNHFFSFFAKKIFTAYKISDKRKYITSGIPLIDDYNKNFIEINYEILIIGGSLGSKPLCDLAVKLSKDYKILLVAGKYYKNYQDNNNLIIYDYLNDIRNYISKARLVISRAGAATTYEIFKENVACIVVPSLNTKKNHQYLNALYFEKCGCAKLFKENELNDIKGYIEYILNNKEIENKMLLNQKKLVINNSIDIIKKEIGYNV